MEKRKKKENIKSKNIKKNTSQLDEIKEVSNEDESKKEPIEILNDSVDNIKNEEIEDNKNNYRNKLRTSDKISKYNIFQNNSIDLFRNKKIGIEKMKQKKNNHKNSFYYEKLYLTSNKKYLNNNPKSDLNSGNILPLDLGDNEGILKKDYSKLNGNFQEIGEEIIKFEKKLNYNGKNQYLKVLIKHSIISIVVFGIIFGSFYTINNRSQLLSISNNQIVLSVTATIGFIILIQYIIYRKKISLFAKIAEQDFNTLKRILFDLNINQNDLLDTNISIDNFIKERSLKHNIPLPLYIEYVLPELKCLLEDENYVINIGEIDSEGNIRKYWKEI